MYEEKGSGFLQPDGCGLFGRSSTDGCRLGEEMSSSLPGVSGVVRIGGEEGKEIEPLRYTKNRLSRIDTSETLSPSLSFSVIQ